MQTEVVTASAEASLASAGTKLATGGGLVSFFAFLSSAQFVAIVGVITAIVGALITWYYKRKDSKQIQIESEARLKLQKEETELRMKIEAERLEMDKEMHQAKLKVLNKTDVAPTPVVVAAK